MLRAFRRLSDEGQERGVLFIEHCVGVFPRNTEGVVNLTDFRRASGRGQSKVQGRGQVCSVGEPGQVVRLPTG